MQTEREFDAALATYEPMPLAPRVYGWRCPKCQRGIANPKFLRRPHWMGEGPRICSTCIAWEQKWSRVEREREERARYREGSW